VLVADRQAVTLEPPLEFGTVTLPRWSPRATVGIDPTADVETVEAARLEDGVTYLVAYNGTAAEGWAGDNCVSGDGRRFGDCTVDGGVASQERAGEAVLLAVAFDVLVVGPDGDSELTVVVAVGSR